MTRWRRLVQGVTFAAFVACLWWPAEVGVTKVLFRADVAATGSASLGARAWLVGLAFALGLLALTVLGGRVFCGWACPMGTIIDVVDAVAARSLRAPRFRALKLHLLVVLACCAAAGVAVAWLLDPLAWASRLAAVFRPAVAERALLLGGAALLGVLAVALGPRAFCRLLCPLGALLALASRVALFRRDVAAGCSACGRCVGHCRMAALGPTSAGFDRTECVHCHECAATCPTAAVAFRYVPRWPASAAPPLPGRRAWLASLPLGVGAATGLRWLRPAAAADAPLLRPPGTVPEATLQRLCVRCGSCVHACPTLTLVPAQRGASPLFLETPVLVGRAGGCRYDCNACGAVCPTGAIRALPLDEKRRARIGTAVIDLARCLPHARGQACLSCHAACPFEAVTLRAAGARLAWGDALLLPVIDATRCTGCALCEARCPLRGEAAVRVVPLRGGRRRRHHGDDQHALPRHRRRAGARRARRDHGRAPPRDDPHVPERRPGRGRGHLRAAR
ncbi:MAG: 4Fe-4S binding protein [Deltaproteobacteria bacterium]|nr:4Fe-4S binding protein [Deltaproteobacteria bacterium]